MTMIGVFWTFSSNIYQKIFKNIGTVQKGVLKVISVETNTGTTK